MVAPVDKKSSVIDTSLNRTGSLAFKYTQISSTARNSKFYDLRLSTGLK